MNDVLHELLTLNQDLAHWLFELEGGIIAFVIGALWHRAWQRKHDRTHHGRTGRMSERHPSEQVFPKPTMGDLSLCMTDGLQAYVAMDVRRTQALAGGMVPTWAPGERIIARDRLNWPVALFTTSRVNDEVTTDELRAFSQLPKVICSQGWDGQSRELVSIDTGWRRGTFIRTGEDTWLLVSVTDSVA